MKTTSWSQAGEQGQNDYRLLVREGANWKTTAQYRILGGGDWNPRFLYLAKIPVKN